MIKTGFLYYMHFPFQIPVSMHWLWSVFSGLCVFLLSAKRNEIGVKVAIRAAPVSLSWGWPQTVSVLGEWRHQEQPGWQQTQGQMFHWLFCPTCTIVFHFKWWNEAWNTFNYWTVCRLLLKYITRYPMTRLKSLIGFPSLSYFHTLH